MTLPLFDRTTQYAVYELCDDPETEAMAVRVAAGGDVVGFERWARGILEGNGCVRDLDDTDFAQVMFLFRP